MKTINFILDGRKAVLSDRYYSDELKAAFSFASPSARYTPSHKKWLQEKALNIPEDERNGWDGKISMMKNGVIDVGLLLGAKDDLAKAGFIAKIKEWKNKPYVAMRKGFLELDPNYEYQNTANTAMLYSIPNGGGLVLSATGSGKTKIAAQFFSWIEGKCLFVVDQVDLLYQSQKEIQMWFDLKKIKMTVGIIGDGEFKPGDVTIATIQTLSKAAKLAKFKKFSEDVAVIMVDEIHVQMNSRNYGVIEKLRPQAVIGLTATMQLSRKPIRYKCYTVCGPVLFEYPLDQGVREGVLSPGVVVQIPVARNTKPKKLIKVRGKKREVEDYTHECVHNENANSLIFGLTQECLRQDLCVVILIERVKHLKFINSMFEGHNPVPRLFFGEIKINKRKKQLKKIDEGKYNLSIANKVFTKGINLKRIDVIIDAAQRSSKNDCMQKYGRAARLHAEKAGIYYFDIFTVGKFEKAAKSRKGAFKKAKIPIKVLDFGPAAWKGKDVFPIADKLLVETLKKQKIDSAQGKLF